MDVRYAISICRETHGVPERGYLSKSGDELLPIFQHATCMKVASIQEAFRIAETCFGEHDVCEEILIERVL